MFRKFLKPLSTTALQTRCDICCVYQSTPFIPSDCDMSRAVDSHKSMQHKTLHGCVSVRAAHCRLHLMQQFIASVRMMACVTCLSRWEASHCIAQGPFAYTGLGIACVTASAWKVRLEVVTLCAPVPNYPA